MKKKRVKWNFPFSQSTLLFINITYYAFVTNSSNKIIYLRRKCHFWTVYYYRAGIMRRIPCTVRFFANANENVSSLAACTKIHKAKYIKSLRLARSSWLIRSHFCCLRTIAFQHFCKHNGCCNRINFYGNMDFIIDLFHPRICLKAAEENDESPGYFRLNFSQCDFFQIYNFFNSACGHLQKLPYHSQFSNFFLNLSNCNVRLGPIILFNKEPKF